MRYAPLIACFVPLALALSAHAGQWPAGAKEQFTQQCVDGAKANVPASKALAYCDCAAEQVGNEFTTEELASMQGKPASTISPATRERLGKASTRCLAKLNP